MNITTANDLPERLMTDDYTTTILPLNGSAQKPTGKPRLHCFFSATGKAAWDYFPLARGVNEKVAFYGIQACDKDLEDLNFAASIEKMATHYTNLLIEAQPDGPFLLAGWSAGGNLALETAKQLQARGREAPLLILIDTKFENAHDVLLPLWHPLYLFEVSRNFPKWLSVFLKNGGSIPTRALRFLKNKILKKGARIAGKHLAEGFGIYPRLPQCRQNFMKQFIDACFAYRVKGEYSGKVIFFEATDTGLFLVQAARRCLSFVKKHNLTVVRVPGYHETILKKPNVQVMIDFVNDWFSKLPVANIRPAQSPLPEIALLQKPARTVPNPFSIPMISLIPMQWKTLRRILAVPSKHAGPDRPTEVRDTPKSSKLDEFNS